MAISDTKLRSIYGKPYSGPQEVADADVKWHTEFGHLNRGDMLT
ncbi:TPA: hypothetical protein ACGH78_004314, partial [Shigella flexneri]